MAFALAGGFELSVVTVDCHGGSKGFCGIILPNQAHLRSDNYTLSYEKFVPARLGGTHL